MWSLHSFDHGSQIWFAVLPWRKKKHKYDGYHSGRTIADS